MIGYTEQIMYQPFSGNDWETRKMHVVEGDKIGFVSITYFSDRWDLDHLWSVTRGGGRVALTYVCELADEARMPVELIACPDYSPGGVRMSMQSLVAWYKQFGFSDDEQYVTSSGNDMRREPR